MNLITKYTILTLFTIVIGEGFDISVMMTMFGYTEAPQFLLRISYALRNIETMVNCIVLYLSHRNNKKFYFNFCSKLHKLCFQCYEIKFKQKVVKRYSQKILSNTAENEQTTNDCTVVA